MLYPFDRCVYHYMPSFCESLMSLFPIFVFSLFARSITTLFARSITSLFASTNYLSFCKHNFQLRLFFRFLFANIKKQSLDVLNIPSFSCLTKLRIACIKVLKKKTSELSLHFNHDKIRNCLWKRLHSKYFR